MVKLHTSLLALTVTSGLALASFDGYQRRDHLLDARDTYDDLEAREPGLFGKIAHIGEGALKKVVKSKATGAALGAAGPGKYAKVFKVATAAAKIGRKAGGGKLGGKLEHKISRKAADKLGHTKIGRKVDSKVRRKATAKVTSELRHAAVKQGKHQVKSNLQQSNPQQSNPAPQSNSRAQNIIRQAMQREGQVMAQMNRILLPHGPRNRPRGLEDSEDISRRDLDAEELFGRGYDLLDERDIFDDHDLD